MANSFYNHGSFPTTGSPGSSASMRAEFDSVAAGFDKLPTLSGNGNFAVKVNPAGTAMIPSTIISDDGTNAKLGKVTISSVATGATLSITDGKTLAVSNSLTLAGTDGTTITMPSTTGTLPLDNQTFHVGTTALTINRASAAQSLTGVNIDGSAGSATTATNLAGGNNTTLLGSIGYQSNTNTTTLLAPNTTTTKKFLTQTGTGANGAAPSWAALASSDVGLGNVENTALSTWAGSTNITTLGTVTAGTWNASTIALNKGGTGAITQIGALQALGAIAAQTAAKTAAYTVVAADRGDVLLCSGTWTLSLTAAATLANGFSFGAVNTGTGIITIDPNLAETVDGLATKPLLPGQSCILITDGSNWRTVGLSGGGAVGGGSDQVFYENGQTVASDYTISTGKNAMSAGPITVSTGVTVTVPDGSVWTIV